METEMDVHLGRSKLERSDRDDYRSDYRPKQVNSSYGSMEIKVPQDRKFRIWTTGSKMRQKDISDIDQKSILCIQKEYLRTKAPTTDVLSWMDWRITG